jgi:hypothetical protein
MFEARPHIAFHELLLVRDAPDITRPSRNNNNEERPIPIENSPPRFFHSPRVTSDLVPATEVA